MKRKNIFTLLSTYILIFSILFTIQVSSEETIENNVGADFNIEMITASDFKVSYNLKAYKLTTDQEYNQQEIKNADERDIGAFEFLLYQELKEQLDVTFLKESFSNFNSPNFNGDTFEGTLDINLTSDFFDLDENISISEFVNGLLDMGAVLNYGFIFQTKAGWNNTFIFDLGENYDLKQTNGAYNHIENKVTWYVKNWTGINEPTSAGLSIVDHNPTTHAKDEDIFLEFILNSTEGYTSLQTNILAKVIDISEYNVLPTFITNLTYIPSDGFRLFVKQNLTSWEDLYEKTLKQIEEKIKSAIETPLFNQTLELDFFWDHDSTINTTDSYSIEQMDEKPALKAILKDDNIKLKILGIPVRGLFGLINTGAESILSGEDINFGSTIQTIEYPYNISLILPEGITLKQQNTFTWNDTLAFNGTLKSNKNPNYLDEEIDTKIIINVRNTDLNLLSFFTGETTLTFSMDITETINYNITTLPDSFSLPNEIDIKFLNSDALRVCFEEKIFSEEMKNNFFEKGKESFEKRISNILKSKISGNIDKNLFEDSLNWDGNINEMQAINPVKTCFYSYISYPIKFDLSVILPSFKIDDQKFTFTGVDNQSVTYQIVFPKGIDIDASDQYDKTVVKQTADGQQYIELSLLPSESNLSVNVTCSMAPSILFILGTFVPCFIAFSIAIIFVIVIILIRRKRKRGKAVIIKEEKQSQDYENEDYYIPPPGSK